MVKATFLNRFIAWFLDGIIMGVLALILSLVIGLVAGLGASTDSSILGILSAALFLMLFIIIILFQFVYFGYFWSKDGQSLGMKILNMKVTRRNGEGLSFWRAAFPSSTWATYGLHLTPKMKPGTIRFSTPGSWKRRGINQ
jgi:uncharacterized RDD family membrane protein YckC